ncbi:THUMP domain-containing protein [Aphelenchoides besseyi]|nr:THUMP domain-containing protein [Aphelenchoides besseyi]
MSVQKRGNRKGYYNNRGNPNFRTNIDFGARGFFFTVDGTNQERRAVREVYNLYDSTKEAEVKDVEIEEEKPNKDAADELEAACQESTSESKNERGNAANKNLRQVPTNVRNCLFFQTEMSADDIYALNDQIVEKCQQNTMCRFVARCIPVEDCAPTELVHLAGSLEKLIHRHFVQNWKDEKPPTYALEFKARNNDQLTRQDVLSVLDERMKCLSPFSRVNLNAPDLTILVNILHKNVLLSCVRGYFAKRKFSVRPPTEKSVEEKAEPNGDATTTSN